MLENNQRSRGLIDQFESIDIDVRKCCEMVADELVKKGLFEDAVKLFDLAEVGFLLPREKSTNFMKLKRQSH